jgi:hypothetical protein
MTRKIQVVLPDQLWDYLQRRKPVSLSVSAFCAALIERGLELTPADRAVLATAIDTGVTLGIRDPRERIPSPLEPIKEKEEENKSRKGGAGGKTNSPFSKRKLDPALVPDELADCTELLLEFWEVKAGKRSERVWKRVCNDLRGWTPEERQKALRASCNAGWGDVYEPKPPKASVKPYEPPQQAHPASRVFTAADFEPPATNPLLENLF